jgi:hypothetical protein
MKMSGRFQNPFKKFASSQKKLSTGLLHIVYLTAKLPPIRFSTKLNSCDENIVVLGIENCAVCLESYVSAFRGILVQVEAKSARIPWTNRSKTHQA